MLHKTLVLGAAMASIAQISSGLSMGSKDNAIFPRHMHHAKRLAVENSKAQQLTTTTVVEYYTVDQDGNHLGSSYHTSAPAVVQPPESIETGAHFDLKSRSEDGSSSIAYGGDFPDGEIDCSEFPSQYGALALDRLDLGGWSGIQIGDAAGTSCEKGAYCSYACPPGQYKSQWPEDQPADGQTRGGLFCDENGKLRLSRKGVPKLCEEGEGSAYVVNEMSQDIAICATDYPGSENMVLPFIASAGGKTPLTVTDSSKCFTWQSKKTSVQYYVNTAGISEQNGCQWGSASENLGNWAPLNFGAGCDQGRCYFSLSPNPLSSTRETGYNVKIVADPGSEMNGGCSFENGVFKNENGDVMEDGCTVCVTSGRAKYVFTSA